MLKLVVGCGKIIRGWLFQGCFSRDTLAIKKHHFAMYKIYLIAPHFLGEGSRKTSLRGRSQTMLTRRGTGNVNDMQIWICT